MSYGNQSSKHTKEIWFFTSELEGERASSFRQERWCRIFLETGTKIGIFNIQGAFHLTETYCSNLEELATFRRKSLANAQPMASVREGIGVRLLRRIKHLLLVDLYLPNVVKLGLHAHRLLRMRDEPVVVMASSPPFSVAVVGAVLKVLHGKKITFAVDMRDAWAMHNALGGIGLVKRAIERVVLRRADYLTTVSYGLAREFEQAYSVSVGVMYNVATHYLDVASADKIDLREVHPELDPNRKKFVYTGSTPVGHYDKTSIVGAMRVLRSKNPELADKVQLVFVGACEEIRREAEHQQVLQGDIVFVSHVPHAVARSIQASADVLLFLAHFGPDNMGVVSTKLFEYLCLGRPVLPLSLHRGSDVDRLLNRYCGNSVNAHTAEEMANQIADVIHHGVDSLPSLDEPQRVKDLLEDYHNYARQLTE